MELGRLYKHTLIILVPLSLLSALIEPFKLPLGIFLGGVFGLVNLKGMKRGLEGLLGTYRPAGKLVFLSLFRLFVLFAAITLLAMTRTVNLFGLLIGFTVVFAVLIKEGLRAAKE